jgi:ubiquinone biosynthesis protein COQ9
MENKAMDAGSSRESLMEAALAHVVFDGWSPAAFAAACADAGVDPALARVISPGGAVDLAVEYHRRGDRLMRARLAAEDLSALRFRDRIAAAVRFRLEGADRELVRRGAALFALPQHAATGAALIWGTADAIWSALGDTSRDFNWYSKRATLSAVYAATVLYWLGDDSEGSAATWDFLDRRIEDVLRFEKAKAQLRESPALGKLLEGPLRLVGNIRAPGAAADLPGRIRT